MKTIAILMTVFLLSSCASTPSKQVMSQAEFARLVIEANDAIEKARSVGGEWSDSRDILRSAELAAKTNDMKKAETLAKQAREQGNNGYQQSIEQKNAKPWLF